MRPLANGLGGRLWVRLGDRLGGTYAIGLKLSKSLRRTRNLIDDILWGPGQLKGSNR